MGTDIQSLPNLRAVYSDTYANLPASGLNVGDLGYATDRLVLYRWNGAAWEAITIHSSSGTAANIPNAADLPDGSIYAETDTNITKQVQGGAWVAIVTPGSALTVGETQVYTGNAPVAWTDLDLSGTIGAKSSLVLLKVWVDGGNRATAFRKNGDTDEFYSAAFTVVASGIALFDADDALHIVTLVATDASGIIEWRSEVADAATVDVIAYIN